MIHVRLLSDPEPVQADRQSGTHALDSASEQKSTRLNTPLATIIAAVVTSVAALLAAWTSYHSAYSSSQAFSKVDLLSQQLDNANRQTVQQAQQNLKLDLANYFGSSGAISGGANYHVGRMAKDGANLVTQMTVLTGGLVTCSDDRVADDYIFQLNGRGEMYPKNEFLIAESSEANLMATTTIRIVEMVEGLPPGIVELFALQVDGMVSGHADKLEILRPKDYLGLARRCTSSQAGDLAGRTAKEHELSRSTSLTDNRLLACARAASLADKFANSVRRARPLSVVGRAHLDEDTTGANRAVSLRITLRNIFTIDPDFDLCR